MSSVRFATVSQSPRMVRTTGLPAAMDAWTAVFALRFKAYSSGFTRFCAMVSGANFVDFLITSDTLWVERELSGSYSNNQIWTDGYSGWVLLAISAGSGAGNVRTYYQRAGGAFTVGPTVDGVTGAPGSFNFQVWAPDGQDNATIDYSLIGVWEVAKSQAAVQSIFGNGRALVDLTSDWFWNACTVAADVDDDQSGNGHALTLTGTPTLVDGDFWNPGVIVVGTAQGGAAATTSTTITVPTVAVNDVLFVAATNRDSTAAVSVSDNDSGSWTRVDSGADGLSGWYRRATAATSAKTITVSGATGSLAATLTVFRNCTTSGNPFENVSKQSNASGTESHSAITPTTNGSFCCLVVGNRNDDVNNVITTPAGASLGAMSLLVSLGSTGGSDCYVAVAGALQDTAASTGSITWAQANSTTVSMVFDLIPASAAGAYSLTADLRTYALAGSSAGLVRGRTFSAATGTFALSGANAGTRAQRKLAAQTGTFAVAGSATTLLGAHRIVAQAGTVALSGSVTGFTHGYRFGADRGQFALAGAATRVAASRRLVATGASFALTGAAATPRAGRQLVASAGAFTLSGAATGFVHGYTLDADTGSLTLAGSATALRAARRLLATGGTFALAGPATPLAGAHRLAAATGSFALAGAQAALLRGRTLTAAPGAFALTGPATALAGVHRLPAVAGVYALTGAAADLVHSLEGTIVATPTAFVLTAPAAGLRADHRLVAGTGEFATVGAAAGLPHAARLTVVTGTFALSGTQTPLRASRRLTASHGAFIETGTAAGLTVQRKLTAAPGAVAHIGNVVALSRGARVTAETGTHAVTGQVVTLRRTFALAAAAAAFVVAGSDVTFDYESLDVTLDAERVAFVLSGRAATLTVQRVPDVVGVATTAVVARGSASSSVTGLSGGSAAVAPLGTAA
jgi:hypothetical protein